MMFKRESAVEGYTEKGWIRVQFKWVVKNLQRERVLYVIGRDLGLKRIFYI